MEPAVIDDLDPFDLPDWLGTTDVTWTPTEGLLTGHRVAGELSADGEDPLPCDLFAVDEAYPAPVTTDGCRARAHQAWQHGQVLLGELDHRLVVVVPGTEFGADRVLEALSRLARAVGASPERYAAHLRIGGQSPRRSSASR